MLDRRALCLMLPGLTLFAGAAISGCAGGPGPAAAPEAQADMLFISPMGEPFRATPPAPYPVAAWFKGADTDGDGKLDLKEFQADAERFFRVLDVNHDGVIDHREIFYYEHRLVPEVLNQALGAWMGRSAPARLWRAQYGGGAPITSNGQAVPEGAPLTDKTFVGAAAYGLLADPEPVQGADIRLTGFISLNDFRTRAEQRFRLLDSTDRGYLTLDSLPETEAEALLPKKQRRVLAKHA